ncbi:hypothetical protein HGRIS_008706 [Hohenbuehelia grisea]|uniref:DUF726-domain-containing protein n=1 Tax=Hohenbuehelia grisea TaxID=104357 RepID=A0ABR3J8S5_9AGAR
MPVQPIAPVSDIFDDDDDGWEDMPVIREDKLASGLDDEDIKKYHYVAPTKDGAAAVNATGAHLDIDDFGNEWRSKVDQNESEYTRLRINEEEDNDEVHLRTKYLFDEDKAMTPLSQMQATKNLLTEAQRIAYVGLCALASREMAQVMKTTKRKELKAAVTSMELWAMKIMGRLYYHMELETQEQKMIESLSEHGVQALDLVPALMTTHTVANPEYDPEEARRQAELRQNEPDHLDADADENDDDKSLSGQTIVEPASISPPKSPTLGEDPEAPSSTPTSATDPKPFQTTARVLRDTSTAAIPGVSTSLSAADENVTLDIRWTVLCDLFLILIADSVYDARSRVLLENVAAKLGLGWLDVVKFESRVTEALEIQEDTDKMEHEDVIDGQRKANKKKRYMMLGLATLGGGLVIGLSAGLLAPVIGAGLGAAFTTIGITGTTGFLAGTTGAAVITTGGVLTGSGIAMRGMVKRTQQVRTFDILPLHNNKRVNCILTVPGFMNGPLDDVRLPFSVLDPIVGDVFSVLWEPEMIQETGGALRVLTGEVLTQIGQTVLSATVMTALMSALQWPIILTKLGYLIDNPWNNALDRAKAAGGVLAEILMQRALGVRPITLIGFSLGARVIFYALLELAKQKAYGIVQDVFLLGATLSVSTKMWCETRSVVSGRYVNAFARNDWVLNYLFRATSGGVGTVAGLRPVQDVPGLENVDVTDKISGHMSYRTFMPLILDQLGFPVFADFFDEPEQPDFEGERVVVREEDEPKKKSWFSRKKSTQNARPQSVSRPPSTASWAKKSTASPRASADDDMPPRMDSSTPHSNGPSSMPTSPTKANAAPSSGTSTPQREASESATDLPLHAGFDFAAIKEIIGQAEEASDQKVYEVPPIPPPSNRSESTPPVHRDAYPDPDPFSQDRPPSAAGQPSRSGLSSVFTRSMSVNDAHDDDDPEEDDPTPSMSPKPLPPMSSNYISDFATPSPAGLLFGGDDGSFWAPPVPEKSPAAFGYSSSSLTTPFGASTVSLGGVGGMGSELGLSSRVSNPFADPSPSSGMSFAGTDGSISFLPSDTDPWALPSEPKKKDTNSNPWG